MLKDKQACEIETQIHMIKWKGLKKRESMWNKPNKQHKESRFNLHTHAHDMRAWDLFKNPNLETQKGK